MSYISDNFTIEHWDDLRIAIVERLGRDYIQLRVVYAAIEADRLPISDAYHYIMLYTYGDNVYDETAYSSKEECLSDCEKALRYLQTLIRKDHFKVFNKRQSNIDLFIKRLNNKFRANENHYVNLLCSSGVPC